MDHVASPPPGWYPDPHDPRLLRYFDGTQWTTEVAPNSATTPMSFPLGAATLSVRAIPGAADADIACSVHGDAGQQLGAIRSRVPVPSVFGRETQTLQFDLLRANGARDLTITRLGGGVKHHVIDVHDGAGRPLGRLRQINSYWRLFRSTRLTVSLETAGAQLGSTDVCVDPDKPFAVIRTPVRDVSGATFATVERRWRYVDGATDFFDYTLTCPQPVAAPLPDLLVATAFTHYLYDRLAIGGPLEAMGRFGRGPGRW